MFFLLLACVNSLVIDVPCGVVDVDVDGHPDDWGGRVRNDELAGRTPTCVLETGEGYTQTQPCVAAFMDVDSSWISAIGVLRISDFEQVRGCIITLSPSEQCNGLDDDRDGLFDEGVCADDNDTAAVIEG